MIPKLKSCSSLLYKGINKIWIGSKLNHQTITNNEDLMELGSLVQQKKTNSCTTLLNVYNRFPVEFIHGDGAYLYDTEDNRYLDFLSGIAVNGFGHNNKQIKTAVKNSLINSGMFQIYMNQLLKKILQINLLEFQGLDSVFFSNSGTEAIEAAIKFARKWGDGRYQIISAFGGFHGRSMGSLSATGQLKLHEGFTPMLKWIFIRTFW